MQLASNAINHCDAASSHRATQPSDVHLMHPIPGTDQSLFQNFRGVLGCGTWPASNRCSIGLRSGEGHGSRRCYFVQRSFKSRSQCVEVRYHAEMSYCCFVGGLRGQDGDRGNCLCKYWL